MKKYELETKPEPQFSREAIRRTVLGRCESFIEDAAACDYANDSNELNYLVTEEKYGVPCAVATAFVENTANISATWIRVYKPIDDPILLGHERSVDYWVEYGDAGSKSTTSQTFEFSPDHDFPIAGFSELDPGGALPGPLMLKSPGLLIHDMRILIERNRNFIHEVVGERHSRHE